MNKNKEQEKGFKEHIDECANLKLLKKFLFFVVAAAVGTANDYRSRWLFCLGEGYASRLRFSRTIRF